MLVTKLRSPNTWIYRESEIRILSKAECQLSHSICSTCFYHYISQRQNVSLLEECCSPETRKPQASRQEFYTCLSYSRHVERSVTSNSMRSAKYLKNKAFFGNSPQSSASCAPVITSKGLSEKGAFPYIPTLNLNTTVSELEEGSLSKPKLRIL